MNSKSPPSVVWQDVEEGNWGDSHRTQRTESLRFDHSVNSVIHDIIPENGTLEKQTEEPNSAGTAAVPGEDGRGTVTLPLPRYHFDGGDEKTQKIEANIGRLVERLWQAEDQLEMIHQQQRKERRSNGDAETPLSPTGSDTLSYSRNKFPYPLSHAHPQSSTYPLSVPLGMGRDGPVLLMPADGSGAAGGANAGAEGAVGAFERYDDESGLSAQDELNLLKAQVQDIARVCKAVAFGDLSQHITVPVQGHVMVELKDIINQMVDRLSTFAAEVTRVSLEVGTEGKLGGQVEVEGVEGRWKELKDVVNRLAENLTSQVRGVALVTKVSGRCREV